MTPSSTPPEPAFPAEPWHRHDRGCYWDHDRCGWVCPPAPAAPPEVVAAEPAVALVPEPLTRTAL